MSCPGLTSDLLLSGEGELEDVTIRQSGPGMLAYLATQLLRDVLYQDFICSYLLAYKAATGRAVLS